MRKELWHAFPYLRCRERILAGTSKACHAKKQPSTFCPGQSPWPNSGIILIYIMRTVLRCIAQMSHVCAVLTDYCRLRSNFCVFLHLLLNPLDSKGSYSATSNNTKWVHWPLMGGLLHLVQ